jgi:NADP-dependent 3-hydroxy acid dehydrogenase YdfG
VIAEREMIKDKVAIGYATALALSRAGAKVAAGARRIDRLKSLQSEITKNGGEIFIQKLDVTIKSECDALADAVIKKWGTIDILVNNAGLQPLSFFKNLKVDEWDKMIDVNIRGVLYCTAAVITHMVNKKSGHIVNISSIAGRIVYPAGSVYCATKHAVTAFSEGLRQEFSQRSNIRITCIEPGLVATELTNTITDKALEKYIERTKQMEALHAEDIADAIVFAVQAPSHVNVNEILIRPTTQER